MNVVFLTADQWRGDCLSALGHPCLKTANLDRLARDSVLFQRHYAQATPCGPGWASLYTGLYLHNHRSVVNGAPLTPVAGDIPSPLERPSGCVFHTRCPQVIEGRCDAALPDITDLGAGHGVSCFAVPQPVEASV